MLRSAYASLAEDPLVGYPQRRIACLPFSAGSRRSAPADALDLYASVHASLPLYCGQDPMIEAHLLGFGEAAR